MKFPKIFYGWWVVAIAFLVNATNAGLYWNGFSVFFLPICRDLNINRFYASLPFSISRGVAAVESPILGTVVDRYGPAKVLFIAVAIAGIGYILLGRVNTYLLFMLAFILVISPAMQGGFDQPSMVAVTRWFQRRRRLALACSTAGFAAGGGVIIPLIALSVGSFGWRPTAMGAGILMMAILLPLSTRMFSSPEARGLSIDGQVPRFSKLDRKDGQIELGSGYTLREAIGKWGYWSLGLSLALRGLVAGILSVHLVAVMVSYGIPESTSGLLVGFYSWARIPTMLALALVANKWQPSKVIGVGAFGGALGLLAFFLMDQPNLWLVAAFLTLIALNDGSWTVAWSIIADFFGRTHFGALRGGLLTMVSVGAMAGPAYAGWVFDEFGTYDWVMLPGCVGLVLAGVLNWTMPVTGYREKLDS